MSSGADRIRAERGRQIVSEGYTAEHDAGRASAIALAAFGYTQHAAATLARGLTLEESLAAGREAGLIPDWWPWRVQDWKPTGDPVRDLVKAGALIAAAIDAVEAERTASRPLDHRGFDFRGEQTEDKS
jgi:hypothetical protein